MRSEPNRLLIVDDEGAIRFAVREYFTVYGYKVDSARGVADAAALLRRMPYAVVILEGSLTEGAGTEGGGIVELIRGRQPSARIVVLTADGSSEFAGEARRLGADAIFPKSRPLSALAQRVSALLSTTPSVEPEASTQSENESSSR